MNKKRIESIDQFRGFSILLMVLANFMTGVKSIPAWLKHSPDIGLTVIDVIAPLFIFAIGLTYGLSFRRRMEREGARSTYLHFFTRFLAILGLGAVMSAFEAAYGVSPKGVDWGVLQAIGMAGLVTLLVIRLPSLYRLLTGLGLLLVYQVLLDRFFLSQVLASPHGGPIGSFSWSAMLILATTLADLFHDPGRWRKFYPWVAAIILTAGILLAIFSPVSKNRVSASYTLISLGISGLIFFLFHWAMQRFNVKSHLLNAWGKNPLTLYVLHYVLIGVVFLPGIPVLYQAAPLWLAVLEMVLLVAAISGIALWLERRNWILSL